jgi:hypothetical protein
VRLSSMCLNVNLVIQVFARLITCKRKYFDSF